MRSSVSPARFTRLSLSLAVALLWAGSLIGTVPADVVVLTNGEELVGRIEREDFEWVTLRTSMGEMRLRREHIAEIRRPAGTISPTEALPVDPSATLPAPGELTTPSESFQALPADVAAAPPPPPEEEEELPESTGEEMVPSAIPPGYAATVFMLDGDVLLKRHADWEDARLGDLLQVGHELRNDDGRSKLMLRGRGEVRLPPNSHLRLEAIDDTGQNVTLNLVRGSVWANVEPPDTGGVNFNVQTPDLTAGVRGTVFNVVIEQDAQGERTGSRVSVINGAVNARSEQRPTLTRTVDAGFSIFCDLNGNFSAPERIEFDLQREYDEWDQWALETHLALAPYAMGPGGDVIQGIVTQQAALEQVHASMVAETAAFTNQGNQHDHLIRLSEAFLAYARDARDLPPSAEEHGADGWIALVEDPGVAGWAGPYLPPELEVPVADMWNNPITYRRQRSDVSGNVYGELVSNGPNGIYSRGLTDDLLWRIRLSDEIQGEIREHLTP